MFVDCWISPNWFFNSAKAFLHLCVLTFYALLSFYHPVRSFDERIRHALHWIGHSLVPDFQWYSKICSYHRAIVSTHGQNDLCEQTPHSGYVTLCYFNHCQHKNHVTMLYHVIDSKLQPIFSTHVYGVTVKKSSVIFTKKYYNIFFFYFLVHKA